jgi:RpiR family carbohydrate utilization transcriptional regulator
MDKNNHTDTTVNLPDRVVFMKIKALRASLKSAELRLADFILENPDKVSSSTINELEEKSGTSYATIIRFSKKTGFAGFKEFKTSLAKDLNVSATMPDVAAGLQIDGADSTEEIVQKTFQSSIKSLQDTLHVLNKAEIDKAVEKILAARQVYIIGTGISSVTAKYAVTRLFRIGLSCVGEDDPTIYKLKAAILQPQDVLIAISSSGRSANIVDAARIARDNNVPIISLCDFAISPLSKISGINLYTTPRNTTQFYELDVQLLTAQINIIDVLFFCCCTKMGPRAIEMIHKTRLKSDREKI